VGRRLPVAFFNHQAAGGLMSTAEDLARLCRAMTLTGPGGRGAGVLPAGLVEDTWTSPPAAKGVFRLRRGGYGLGQIWGDLPSGKRFVANVGSRPGWRSLVLCLPDDGHAITVVTNSTTGLPLLAHLARRWLKRIHGERLVLRHLFRVPLLVPRSRP
jgi:CubicO group peptidase (beta-lactamase class C family)